MNSDVIEAAAQRAATLTPRFRKLLEHADKTANEVAQLLRKKPDSIKAEYSVLYKRLGLSVLPNRSKRTALLEVRSRLRTQAEPEPAAQPAKPVATRQETKAIAAPSAIATSAEPAERDVRPLVISHAEVELGARRVHLLQPQMRDVLALVSEGLDNVTVARRLKLKYGAVTQAMTTMYYIFDLQKFSDWDDKRAALTAIYRRSLERTDPAEERPVAAAASADRERLEYLESAFNTILDIAEAALKRIGGKRRSS